VDRERAAVDLINSVGQLMYGRGVELVFFRNHLLDISISEVIKLFNLRRAGGEETHRRIHHRRRGSRPVGT
jgi:hypothetical protein